MFNLAFNNRVIGHIKKSSILCLNGYWDNITKKCSCYSGYKLENYNKCKLITKFNKVNHLRNMLSNETLSNVVKEESSDYTTIIISLIAIICGLLFITYLYKKWKRIIRNKEENEDNKSSIQAKTEFEKNYLNSKTFSFIPISSPIKLKDIKDIKTQKPDINIDENNSNITNNSEIKLEEPGKIKNNIISSFSVNSDHEIINVKKSI